MRHRIRRLTLGKVPIKHSSTLVDNTGQGVGSFFTHQIFVTGVGIRGLAGQVQNLKENATNESTCEVGDTIKYVNICLEASPRGATPTNPADNCAWLEWAVVFQQERDAEPTVANIGVATLGVICSHAFRENCLMTGCFPVGTQQSMAQDIKIKLPRKCIRLRQGYVLNIFCFIRTSSSTDTRTDSHRLIASSHFKSYS